jgi:hypothetical protein
MKESNTNRVFNQDNLWQDSVTAPITRELIRQEVQSAELSRYVYKHPDAWLYPLRDAHQ